MAAEKIVDVIENAQEIVEETLDVLEAVPAWRCGLSRKQHFAQIVALSVIAAGVGGAVAYYTSRKKLEAKYNEIADREIAEAKTYFRTLYKRDEADSPEKVLEERHPDLPIVRDAAEAVRNYQGKGLESVVQGIVEAQEEVVLSTEVPTIPMVITEEEFLIAETGFEQRSFTYFVGDTTLADHSDMEIESVVDLVGEGTLQRFLDDEELQIVYVRNHKLSLDLEIHRSDGLYSREVLGLTHSDDYGFEKFRGRRGSGEDG